MIELRHPLPSDDLAQRLEDYFCEWVDSPWGLLRRKESDPYTLFAYFEEPDAARAAWAELSAAFKELPEAPEHTGTIADEDWKEAYKHHLHPWNDRGLHWVPVWEKETYPVPDGEAVVYLDAGMAFGTGSHETTRLMARRLLDYREAHGPDLSTHTLIDAGCGTGILALSGKLLGFGTVYAFDHDPEAARVTRENLADNGLAGAVEVAEAGIEAGLEGRAGTAHLMLANIQSNILQIYAKELVAAMAPGSTLALSGILSKELDQVEATFAPVVAGAFESFSIDRRIDGEWGDLCFTLA